MAEPKSRLRAREARDRRDLRNFWRFWRLKSRRGLKSPPRLDYWCYYKMEEGGKIPGALCARALHAKTRRRKAVFGGFWGSILIDPATTRSGFWPFGPKGQFYFSRSVPFLGPSAMALRPLTAVSGRKAIEIFKNFLFLAVLPSFRGFALRLRGILAGQILGAFF